MMLRNWLIGIITEALERYFARSVEAAIAEAAANEHGTPDESFPEMSGVTAAATGTGSDEFTNTYNKASQSIADTLARNFDVRGNPRPIPWRLRKAELEAQHRKKRKQRDEFREMA